MMFRKIGKQAEQVVKQLLFVSIKTIDDFSFWKNRYQYFAYVILYLQSWLSYSVHVPNNRYTQNDEMEEHHNAASAWYPDLGEHDLRWTSLPSSSLSSPWRLPGQRPSARNAARTVHEPCESDSHRGGGITVFDMNKSVDRRQVLTVLGIIFALSCIPTLLVVFTQLTGRMLPSVLIGIALYFVFLRKK